MHIELTRSVRVKVSIKRALYVMLPYCIMLISLAMACCCIFWICSTWSSKSGTLVPTSATAVSTKRVELTETLVYSANSTDKGGAVAELAMEHYDLT